MVFFPGDHGGARATVVRVIARLNVGGPAWHVIHLSRGLQGKFPTVLVAGTVADGERDLSDFARQQGVRLHVIPELGRKIHLWDDLVAFLKLVRLLRSLRPTIVHTHTAKAGALGRVAAVVAGVPVRIHTFHGHVFRGYFGPLATRLIVFAERMLARFSHRVVTVSERLAEEIVGEFGICSRQRVRVIPLGLDLGRFRPELTRPLRESFRAEVGAGDAAVVTIVGRLAPVKNHKLFLEAAALVLATGYSAKFAVVGGGTEESRLREHAAALRIDGNVRFLGWRTDLERVYGGSDLVALTSVNEGTPVCLIEALAAGCAVVSTDVGGVRDALEDGRLGILVPSHDAESMAHAIISLLNDSDARQEFGRRGLASIPRRFAVERLLDETGRLYDELLPSRRLAVDALGQGRAARLKVLSVAGTPGTAA